MANIEEYLNKIESAVYGREVRKSIHDAIQDINDKAFCMKVPVSGDGSVTCKNSEAFSLLDFKLYGKCVQNGTPSPTAPVSIKSVGDDGNATIKVAVPYVEHQKKEIIIPLSSPLYGIGNVKDAIKIVNGKYVIERNCGYTVFDGSGDEAWTTNGTSGGMYRVRTNAINNLVMKNTSDNGVVDVVCSILSPTTPARTYSRNEGIAISTSGQVLIYASDYATSNISLWKSYLASNPMTVIYPLATPIYEELTPAQIQAINSLQTFEGITIIDAGIAGIEVAFCADSYKTILDLIGATAMASEVATTALYEPMTNDTELS